MVDDAGDDGAEEGVFGFGVGGGVVGFEDGGDLGKEGGSGVGFGALIEGGEGGVDLGKLGLGFGAALAKNSGKIFKSSCETS